MRALSGAAESRGSIGTRGLLALAVGVVAFAIYLPARDGEFVFDDRKLVLDNAELWRSNDSLGGELAHVLDRMGGIFRAEEETAVRTGFRPVRFSSLRLDVRVTRALGLEGGVGEDPSPQVFHFHNALLHALNAILLALLVARLRPGAPLAFPALFALAFALHPVHTESVAYISGRRDVLFLTFYLLGLLIYAGGRRDGGWLRGLALAAVTWLALGAKEMAITLPVAMVLCEGLAEPHPGDRPGFRRALDRLPLWLPSLLAGLLFAGLLLGRQNPGGGTDYWGGSPATAFWGSGRAILEYARLMLWPQPLSVDYSFDAFTASRGPFSPWTGAFSVAFIVAALVVAWRRRSRDPELATAVFLFPLLLLPVAQWIPHPERFAEHNLYLPSLAFLAIAVPLLRRGWARAPEATAATVGIVLLVWGGLSVARLEAWSGPYTLWRSAAEVHPTCARAHFGWGNAAQQRGRSTEAVQALGIAVDLLAPVDREPLQQGYYLQALQIRAGILATSNLEADLSLARRHLETLLEETDTDGTPVDRDPVVWLELLKVRERLDDREGARAAAARILELDAPSAIAIEAALFIAAALAESEDVVGSEAALLDAMGRATTDRERALVWYQIGVHRQQRKEWSTALEAFQRAEAKIGERGRRSSARYRIAECHLHRNELSQARTVLENLLQDEPGHFPALLSLGEIELGRGELDSAQACFTAVLVEAPDESRARQGLAQIFARRSLEKTPDAPSPDPTRVTVLTLLANRLEAEEKLGDAVVALDEAEALCEGPDERDRRLALRLRLARLHVRRAVTASRDEEDEAFAIVQLESAAKRYGQVREIARPEERGEAAIEAAEIARVLAGPEVAYGILSAEHEAGVREPRLFGMLGGLAELAGETETAKRWYRAALDDPTTSDEGRARATAALERLGEEG